MNKSAQMAEEIVRPERMSIVTRWARWRRVLIVLTLTVAATVIWLTGFRSAAEAPTSCDAHYNELVKRAKDELINGDRSAAIKSLIAARATLRDCETPTAKDVAPIWRN